jgi:hypothetical protein
MSEKPNIVCFRVGPFGDGKVLWRRRHRRPLDPFVTEGFRLLHFPFEAPLGPSRATLLTGRHAIRTFRL